MWKFVIQDLTATLQYIPYGLLVGGLLCFLLQVVRKKKAADMKISVVEVFGGGSDIGGRVSAEGPADEQMAHALLFDSADVL